MSAKDKSVHDVRPNDVINFMGGKFRVRYIRYTSGEVTFDLQKAEHPISPYCDHTCLRLSVMKSMYDSTYISVEVQP